jgi:uncharacterized protein (DUF1499 family)
MIPARLAYFDAILALALWVFGPIGAHIGTLSPIAGFTLFLVGSGLGLIGLLLGLAGMFTTRDGTQPVAHSRARFATVVGLVLVAVLATGISRGRSVPPINDITTDFENPPEFVHAVDIVQNHGRDMKYDKAKYSDAQTKGYAKLEPATMTGDAAAVFEKVRALAAATPTWQITSTDPATMTIEGVATSWLFQFQDDFVIRVRPLDGGKCAVDMRSKSRDGIGDFGANFKRIVGFFSRLNQSTAAG